jgi:Aldehyde dehydrogenase family
MTWTPTGARSWPTSGHTLRHPGTFALALRRPLGVVAGISPWNGGHVLAWRTVVNPLAFGNTVILKPSEERRDQNGNPCAWSRTVTQRQWVNSSQLLCDPNRAPLPEAPVPPNGAYASLFSV